MMGPDKEYCAVCDGDNVVGCSFKGGSECRPRKAKPCTIRTFNPSTHVVVSRDAAKAALESIGECSCRSCRLARPELRAALEVGK